LPATVNGGLLSPLIENDCPVTFSCEITTGADPWFEMVMFVLAVLPTATWPKSTVLDDTVSVPVAAVFTVNEPPQPYTARPHEQVSSPKKLNFNWRIFPPNGRKDFIGARTKLIAKAN